MMSLEQAVEVLNRERHRGHEWGQYRPSFTHCVFACGEDLELTEFETIAIAEKYERERARRESISGPGEIIAGDFHSPGT